MYGTEDFQQNFVLGFDHSVMIRGIEADGMTIYSDLANVHLTVYVGFQISLSIKEHASSHKGFPGFF